MDFKDKKRSVVGILILTVIFALVSIFSVSDMFSGIKTEEKLKKTDYMLLLENELEIEFNSEDDFINFDLVNYEMVVEPTKYQYYYKPCFDFVIERDGVVITNRLSEEFDILGLKTGLKITKIGEEVLAGKGYFEILELLYSKEENEIKEFTFSDNSKISYEYKNYYSTYLYEEENNVLTLYNLDNLTTKAVYDLVTSYEDVTLDLSKASVTTYDGVVNFLSLFSSKDEVLFQTPEGVIGQKGRKIDSLNIIVKDNTDNGILFVLTTIKTLNSNIKIDKTDLNTTHFFTVNKLRSANYTIYLKNYLLQTKTNSNSGETVL